ncbi:hypothetical protein [Pseudochrobactrum sp. B5]|uniref:hypothetical protein n=1 Tax=Pseudochrobactrum sp. B5 TaxID=1289478 RepID=UPI00095298E4|nr:hypothetical protein [Pseudochrobactrum sp. B5]
MGNANAHTTWRECRIIQPDRRILSANTGIFAYILMDGSGTPTIIEIVAVSSLLINLIAFATIPRKLTKPLQQPCRQN